MAASLIASNSYLGFHFRAVVFYFRDPGVAPVS